MFLYNDLKHNEQKKQHITDITQQNFFTKIIKGSGVINAKSYPRDWNNYLSLKYLTLHSHSKKKKQNNNMIKNTNIHSVEKHFFKEI